MTLLDEFSYEAQANVLMLARKSRKNVGQRKCGSTRISICLTEGGWSVVFTTAVIPCGIVADNTRIFLSAVEYCSFQQLLLNQSLLSKFLTTRPTSTFRCLLVFFDAPCLDLVGRSIFASFFVVQHLGVMSTLTGIFPAFLLLTLSRPNGLLMNEEALWRACSNKTCHMLEVYPCQVIWPWLCHQCRPILCTLMCSGLQQFIHLD